MSSTTYGFMENKKNITNFLMKKMPYLDLFVLRFYYLVNPMGSCQARSVYLRFYWAD